MAVDMEAQADIRLEAVMAVIQLAEAMEVLLVGQLVADIVMEAMAVLPDILMEEAQMDGHPEVPADIGKRSKFRIYH